MSSLNELDWKEFCFLLSVRFQKDCGVRNFTQHRMGSFLSWRVRGDTRRSEDSSQLLHELHGLTGLPIADLEEMHFLFMRQHPDGFLHRDVFIKDNVKAHGGPPELWNRVFDFASLLDSGAETTTSTTQRVVDGLTFREVMLASTKEESGGISFERLVQNVFRFLDLHGDGFIDEEELKKVIGWLYQLSETSALRQSTEVLDKFCSALPRQRGGGGGDDGRTISNEALRAAYPPLVDPTARALQIMRWMDLDGDGLLCESEFAEVCRGDQTFVEAFSFVAS